MADKVSLPTPDEEVVFSSRSSIRFDFTKSLYNSVCNGVNLHMTTCSILTGKYFVSKACVRLIIHLVTIDESSSNNKKIKNIKN